MKMLISFYFYLEVFWSFATSRLKHFKKGEQFKPNLLIKYY